MTIVPFEPQIFESEAITDKISGFPPIQRMTQPKPGRKIHTRQCYPTNGFPGSGSGDYVLENYSINIMPAAAIFEGNPEKFSGVEDVYFYDVNVKIFEHDNYAEACMDVAKKNGEEFVDESYKNLFFVDPVVSFYLAPMTGDYTSFSTHSFVIKNGGWIFLDRYFFNERNEAICRLPSFSMNYNYTLMAVIEYRVNYDRITGFDTAQEGIPINWFNHRIGYDFVASTAIN